MTEKNIIIYTDGSCLNNPGVGGWAALLIYGDKKKEITGGEMDTTNNRMELTAAIEALNSLKKNLPITLYTDSRYLQDGIQKYCHNWVKNNWRTANKKPVKNKDLWEQIYELNQKYNIEWHWVKAHHIDEYNHRVDHLAHETALKFQKQND